MFMSIISLVFINLILHFNALSVRNRCPKTRAVIYPSILLHLNVTIPPGPSGFGSMIEDPVLLTDSCKAAVSGTDHPSVSFENRFRVFLPGRFRQGIIPIQPQHPQAIVIRPASAGRIDKVGRALARFEYLRPFIDIR